MIDYREYPELQTQDSSNFIFLNRPRIAGEKHFYLQKLSYIHNNPCSGIWKLAESPVDYIHSSAKYYATGEQGIYLISDDEILFSNKLLGSS